MIRRSRKREFAPVNSGSAARPERASASVYLEEFVRKDDYIRNRHHLYQPTLF